MFLTKYEPHRAAINIANILLKMLEIPNFYFEIFPPGLGFSEFIICSLLNSKSVLGEQMCKNKVMASKVKLLRLNSGKTKFYHFSLCIFNNTLKVEC